MCRDCEVRTTTDCITVNPELPNIGTDAGEVLSTVLELIDERLSITPPVPTISITNVGTGAQSFKGLSNLGNYEFRSIQGSENVIVTQTDNNITIEAPDQRTYTASNAGNLGIGVYKDSTVGSTNTQFNFKNVNSTNTGSIGVEILNAISQTNDNITISAKKISSDSLTITEDEGVISINTPTTNSIPALYVNNLHTISEEEWISLGGLPYRGTGSLATPFTDTITGYVAGVPQKTLNSSIGNALLAYLGSGTRISPEKQGQEIVIQNNTGEYIFNSDLNYNFIRLKIQGAVSFTYSGYLVNMDDVANFGNDSQDSRVTITLDGESTQAVVNGLGLLNSGNKIATNTYQKVKNITIDGTGMYYDTSTYTADKYMFTSDPIGQVNGTTGCNNDGNIAISISARAQSSNNGICKVGGKSRIEISKTVSSGLSGISGNTSLKAFYVTGGSIRMFNAVISSQFLRDNVFYIEPLNGFTPQFIARDTRFTGSGTVWFNKANNNQADFDMANCNTLFFTGTQLFNSTNLWPITFRNNLFESVAIDFTKVDFTKGNTISAINTIGNSVIETLQTSPSRTAAAADPSFAKNSKFINTNSANVDKATWFIDIVIV